MEMEKDNITSIIMQAHTPYTVDTTTICRPCAAQGCRCDRRRLIVQVSVDVIK
jgi:hypothetical protein